jgi:hypothetical protein
VPPGSGLGWRLISENPIKILKNEKEVLIRFNNNFDDLNYYFFRESAGLPIELTDVTAGGDFNKNDGTLWFRLIDVDKRPDCILSGSVEIMSENSTLTYFYFDDLDQIIKIKAYNRFAAADSLVTTIDYDNRIIHSKYNNQCFNYYLLDQAGQITSKLGCDGTTSDYYFYNGDYLDSLVSFGPDGNPLTSTAYRKYVNGNPTEIRSYVFSSPNNHAQSILQLITYDNSPNPFANRKFTGILFGKVGVNNPSRIERFGYIFNSHLINQVSVTYQQGLPITITTFSTFSNVPFNDNSRVDYFYKCN